MISSVRKAVPGWEGFYEVSADGRVFSVTRTVVIGRPHGGFGPREYRGRELKANPNVKNGYPMVALAAPGRGRKCRTVHSLVAEAFHGPCPPGLEVRHLDGVRTHCAKDNLEYGTRSQNALDRHAHGTMNPKRGVESAAAKLTEADVIFIRTVAGAVPHREIARALHVHHTTIGNVVRGVSWAHI